MSNDLYMDRLRDELERPPFHSVLKPQPVSVDAELGTVVVRLPYDPILLGSTNPDRYHGGVLATLIDLTAYAAVAVQLGRATPTVDLRIDFLRPTPAGDLLATARTLRVGRALARVDVEITSAEGSPPLVVGRGTFSTLSS
jgi:uncharacterized protein (TIGR00369 family)